MSDFSLHPRLAADTFHVADLPLCQVRLMNDARYAWLVLVPRRDEIREVYELPEEDQARLWKEATALGKALMAAKSGDKLNLATLGNMVPQLHLHVIVRHQGDDAWPGPVWGHGSAVPYDAEQEAAMRACLRDCLEASGLA
ncbi:HIT family protein [Halomonas sp. YLGW01]|uniref:HIT domain-containing protein n=1 Tax=Halomonas sp. YLGW01 TaxID=2773308 RepID=UPI00177B25CF|nr:HIT family protein [Halomonas sp. YLGW01]